MENRTEQIELVRLHAESVHESAEMASALYERDRLYHREDLYHVIDAKHLESAQIIAELFLRAAAMRDALHLRALFEALAEAWETRSKRRQLARPNADALGISSSEFYRRQQRMTELVGFLAMEILAMAFILVLGKDSGEDGGSTVAYLIKSVPELKPQTCPIAEDLPDVDQHEDYDQEGQR